jgi:hypothetical protein
VFPVNTFKRAGAVLLATLAMGVVAAAPANAQTQEGLVNVYVSDVYVQVPVAVAANICDVNVNALAQQRRGGGAECDATAESTAVTEGACDGDSPTQRGLVNVTLQNLCLQIPVGIAANVCDANVNVLARQQRRGGAECEAVALPRAELPA